jgi:hypothetical protein
VAWFSILAGGVLADVFERERGGVIETKREREREREKEKEDDAS